MIRFIFLLLFSAMLLVSCNEEEPLSNTINNGPLKNVKSYLEGTNWLNFNLHYTETNQISKIDYQYPSFNQLSYEIIYENEQVQKIIHTIDYVNPSSEDQVRRYSVTYDHNKIFLTSEEFGNDIIITTTAGFVDSGRVYYGDDNEFYTEEIFKRDADNNIENTTLYDTDQVSGELVQAWKQDFSNFEGNIKFKSAFNPVFDIRLTEFYRILNLKISNENPTHCSRLYGDGNLIEDYQVILFNFNAFEKVEQIILEYSGNTYEYKYEYYK